MDKQTKLLDLEAYGFEEKDGKIGKKKKGSLKAEDLGEIGDIFDAAILEANEFEWEGEKKVSLKLNIPDLGEKEEDRIRFLGLNVTNLGTMLRAFGKDLSKWENQMVEARVEQTTFNGKPISCIRLYPKKAKK